MPSTRCPYPLHRVHGRGWKIYSTFALTDEAYALTSTGDAAGRSRARIVSGQAFFHVCWVLSVTLGAVLGGLIPPPVAGLSFAVTALFAVLGIGAYRIRKSIPLPVLGLACALAPGIGRGHSGRAGRDHRPASVAPQRRPEHLRGHRGSVILQSAPAFLR